jgi:hypothetical protein
MADLRTLARRKAQKYGLDPNVFERQIRQESGFNPNARSPAGAIGVAQIMPATAKGWGVNPRDPNAALDAAAKNMARYVQQFGSYKNALVAYNAGPGRVGKSLPAETQNYIKTILGGSSPSTSSVRTGGSATGSTTTEIPGQTFKTTVPTVDKAGFEQARKLAIVGGLIARRNPNSFLLRSGLLSTQEPTLSDFTGSKTVKDAIPGVTVRTPAGSTAAGGAGGGNFGKSHSPLLELIHKGDQPYAVKNGQKVSPSVYSAVWDNHANHVHVAAGPKTTVDIGRLAQQMGLHVGENPHFGGVSPVHVPGSYHYKGEAIDVSGDPTKMNQFAKRVERLYGIR